MDLMDVAQLLGNFGEFFGAIAVVATLGYLAVQVRQNTRSVRAATYQAFSESYGDFRTLLVKDERLGALFGKGLRSRSEFSTSERFQFDGLMMNFTRVAEVNFYHEIKGLVDEPFYRGWQDEAVEIWRLPGAREWWSENSRFFNADFRASWDRRITKP
jgi:hypothetical protein